jgi:hypothetical protein
MSQQKPYMGEDEVYKRRLFYDNGIRYVEVEGKFVNEYKPPTPVMKSHANQSLQSQSGLVQSGTAHYETEVTLLFYSKKEYADYLQYIGSQHKYYDEKGTIYIGIVDGSPDISTLEGHTKYMVTLQLLLIRKSEFETRSTEFYIDTAGHWAEQYIDDMKERNLISVYDYNGAFVQYFRPEDQITRAETASMVMRSFKYLEKLLRGY